MTADARTLQRQIHLGCKQLGLDDELRHDLQLAVTGKASMRDMDVYDLRRMLNALENRGFKPGFRGVEGRVNGRRAPAPRPDLRFVHVLWGKLGEAGALKRPGRDGLNSFLRARFEAKWGAVPIDVDALCDAGQINDVIRALKSMCARAGVALE